MKDLNDYAKRLEEIDYTNKRIGQEIMLRMIDQHIKINPKNIIEFGCGTGWRISEIQSHFGVNTKAYGVEPSEYAIKRGKDIYKNVEYFDCNTFDALRSLYKLKTL